MRFSSLAAAITITLSGVRGAPFTNTTTVDITTLDIEVQRATLKYLHSQNLLDWKTANGGEVVFITVDEIHGALPHIHASKPRRDTKKLSDRNDITTIVDNIKAQISCFGSGYKVAETVITPAIETACESVLGALPGGPQLQQGWAIYKFYQSVTDDKGNVGDILFKFMQGQTPTFSMSLDLCEDAMTALSDKCTGAAGNSQGGTMGLGDGMYYFDVDPTQL